jgi:hypothetical protein
VRSDSFQWLDAQCLAGLSCKRELYLVIFPPAYEDRQQSNLVKRKRIKRDIALSGTQSFAS